MLDATMLIGGRNAPASGGATFERHNPVSGDVATRAAAATTADANSAAGAAAAVFPAWAALGPSERRALLLKAADALEAETPEFIRLCAEETGATASWIGFSVKLAAGMPREAAGMTMQVTGEVVPSNKPGCLAMTIRQPAGVVPGIAPWNAPVILAIRTIGLPLACGNAVVMPFGGVKASGCGRSGVAAFTDLRWTTIETVPRHYPFPAATGAH